MHVRNSLSYWNYKGEKFFFKYLCREKHIILQKEKVRLTSDFPITTWNEKKKNETISLKLQKQENTSLEVFGGK